MKRLLVALGIVVLGIVLCASPSYAACTLNPDNGPYVTVTKYFTGKAKVQEKWECVYFDDYLYTNANSVCFYNFVDNANYKYICISGEYKVEYPVEEF